MRVHPAIVGVEHQMGSAGIFQLRVRRVIRHQHDSGRIGLVGAVRGQPRHPPQGRGGFGGARKVIGDRNDASDVGTPSLSLFESSILRKPRTFGCVVRATMTG